MDKEAQILTRHCKFDKKKMKSPIGEIIATQLTEELMDQFQITKEKRQKLREIQAEFTKKTKLKEFRHRLMPLYQQIPRMNLSHKDIRGFADMGPSTDMSVTLEFAIKHRICARGLESKYCNIIENIMADAKVEFVRITHEVGVSIFSTCFLWLHSDSLNIVHQIIDIEVAKISKHFEPLE